jgi:ribose transport system permease protein
LNREWAYRLTRERGAFFAFGLWLAMFGLFLAKHPAGFSGNVINTAANKGALLALVAMAQTLPVLTGGLDLSVGMVFVLSNCVASNVVAGSPLETAVGVLLVLATGIVCGVQNGALVVLGRLPPLLSTLATGSIAMGVALWLRPEPGGAINEDFADLLTASLAGTIPCSLLVLACAVLLVWQPYRLSVLGRSAYAIGSSIQSARLSGVPVARAQFLTYVLAGLFASTAGLLLTCVTYTGEANSLLASSYTLSSIAAVVIGGTSLYGGSGGAIGSVMGAFVLCTTGDLLLVFDMDPLWQPLFLGLVLLASFGLGSLRWLGVKNRLELYR